MNGEGGTQSVWAVRGSAWLGGIADPQDACHNPICPAQTQPCANPGPRQKNKLPTEKLIHRRVSGLEAKQLREVVGGGDIAEQRRNECDQRGQSNDLRKHRCERVWRHKRVKRLTLTYSLSEVFMVGEAQCAKRMSPFGTLLHAALGSQ